jgi:hypothetical protein
MIYGRVYSPSHCVYRETPALPPNLDRPHRQPSFVTGHPRNWPSAVPLSNNAHKRGLSTFELAKPKWLALLVALLLEANHALKRFEVQKLSEQYGPANT